MSAAATTPPPIGPNTVRAWFDSVYRPLLLSLKQEVVDLEAHRWQWRFRPPLFGAARPIARYLDLYAVDNLEQICELYEDFRKLGDDHDRHVESMEVRCSVLQVAVRDSDALDRVYESMRAESEEKLGSPIGDFFGAFPEADHRAVLAEHLINRSDDLPAHYAISKLWNAYSNRLGRVRADPEIATALEELESEASALMRVSAHLIAWITDSRRDLSRHFDQPPYDPGTDVARLR